MNEDSSQSETQGFIPNRFKITSSFKKDQLQSDQKQSYFQPKYIFGSPILKKEPKILLQNVNKIQINQFNGFSSQIFTQRNHQKMNKSVRQQYLNKNQYQLVYSRLKQPFKLGQKSLFQNQIKLNASFLNGNRFKRLRQDEIMSSYNNEESNLVENKQLVFDSKFEGGNLLCAFKSLFQKNHYTLFMQNDTNTYGYNQWFYFSLKNVKPGINYIFSIVNFKKKYSFFTKGMQPIVFSYQKYLKTGQGWYRDGNNISYEKSSLGQDESEYYTLQLTINFQHQNDMIWIAANRTYSYTKLINFIQQSKILAQKNEISFQTSSICQSLGGNSVPYIVLSQKQKVKKQKSIIIIMARQHPGQSLSSYLMEQIIKYLVTQCRYLQNWLLSNYQFHIFPMVNVDGVIYGNFRCDLSGQDMNRCWKNPSKYLHPQNYYIKQRIQKLSQRKVQLFLDLHTHSNALNCFAFSCVQSEEGKKLPRIMSQITSLFHFPSCTFNIEKQKQMTSRAIAYHFTKNINTITIQLSSYGYMTNQIDQYAYFNQKEFKVLAKCLINSFIVYRNNANIKDFCQIQRLQDDNTFEEQRNSNKVQDSDSQPQKDQIQISKKIENIYPTHIQRQFMIKNKKILKKKKKKKLIIEIDHSQINNRSAEFEQVQVQQKIRTRVKTQYQSTKIKNQQSNLKINNSCSQAINLAKQKLQKKTLILQRNLYKNVKQAQINLGRVKMKTQIEPKPLNFVQFSLNKLPIFSSNNMNKRGNRSIFDKKIGYGIKQRIVDKKSALFNDISIYNTNKKLLQTEYRTNDTNKQRHKKSVVTPKNGDICPPFLCILSDNKKKEYIEQKKQQIQANKTLNKALNKAYNISSLKQHNLFQSKYERKKDKIEILQKSWIKNACRYYPNVQTDK